MEKDLTTLEDIMKMIRKWKEENGNVFFAGFFAKKVLIRNPDPELKGRGKTEVKIEITPFASGNKEDIQPNIENLNDLINEEKEWLNFGYPGYNQKGNKI